MYTLNTATLSTRRGRIWRQSQYKTPWIAFRGHSRSRIVESLKRGRWTAYYCYNDVGFRVGNFEGKVWASQFSRTTLLFAPTVYKEHLGIFAQTLYLVRFDSSRSSKVIDFGSLPKNYQWKAGDFLFVRRSNCGPLLHRFRDIAGFCAHEPNPIPP